MKIANINIDVDTLFEDALLNYKREELSDSLFKQMVEVTYNSILPRVLDYLDKYAIKANFMIIGRDALVYPEGVRLIIRRGHEIGNHTQNHYANFSFLSKEIQQREIIDCQNTIKSITGKYPKSFRAPGYTITPQILKILIQNSIDIDISLVNALPYLIIKKFYKMFIARNKENLRVQSLWSIFIPNSPRFLYNTAFMQYPVTNSPIFNFPMITSLLIHLGIKFRKILFNSFFLKKYLNCNLHVLEFVAAEDVEQIPFSLDNLILTRKYVHTKISDRLQFFDDMFTRITKNYKVGLLTEIRKEMLECLI